MIEAPENEARELIAALLDVPRFWPALYAETPVDETTRRRALDAAAKRACGAPMAYAVGRCAFRHVTLEIDERALIPRPETEQLVDLVLEETADAGGVAIDVGTGSGAIALALATEASFSRIYATDVSLDALAVARRNVQRHEDRLRAPVELRHGSLLAPFAQDGVPTGPSVENCSLVVSNLPYIADGEAGSLPASVRDWEPAVALFSGADGLRATRALVRQAASVLSPDGLFALEVDARRAALVAELVASEPRFGAVRVALDLSGRERFVLARRQERDGRRGEGG
jgi:release factor glutamine methyltransferase